MPIILYGGKLSPYVARVALTARYKGIKYTLTPPPDGMKSPAYLKINPFGKVPALKDGKLTIFESTVIVEYLEAKSKTKKLVPKNAKVAAGTRLIGAVAADYVQPASLKLFPFFKGVQDTDALEKVATELNNTLDVLQNLIPKGKFAAGNKFSIADVYVLPAVLFAVLMSRKVGLPDPVAARSKLKKYLAVMRKDKIAAQTVADIEAEWKQLIGG